MELVTVTPIYVALTALWMIVLAVRVANGRGKHKVSLGDGGNEDMSIRMRGFGNLVEYAPAVLLLLLMLELKGIEQQYLHIYGAVFVVCRVVHPFALFGQVKPTKFQKLGRMLSVIGTLLLMLIGALALLAF